MSFPLRPPFLALALVWLSLACRPLAAGEPPAPPLYALIFGGGPDLDSNAAQIEGHVRFVGRILPAAAKRFVYFADGKSSSATVSALDVNAIADGQRALSILLPDEGLQPLRRPPDLGMKIDGPSRLPELRHAMTRLGLQASARPAPLLLYFAGHGDQDGDKTEETRYEMWDGDELSVRDLAAEIARLPLHSSMPIVLVMAQCYSGAFANVLFRGGEPGGAFLNRDLAGFFSTRQDRVASGCSPETDEADYQDFSSYFFGALRGHDRLGHAIENADFDGDGKVSLHEAFCYALIHDASIDTPVCTSDVFLKRFAPLPEADTFGQPYGKIWQAATPAQRAALDALSQQLGLSGEQRPLLAHDRLKFSDPTAQTALIKSDDEAADTLNALRLTTLDTLFKHLPALRWSDASAHGDAVTGAAEEIGRNTELAHSLIAADKRHQQTSDAVDTDEAALLRFTGLCESVMEASSLRQHAKEELKSQFERLWAAEQRSLPISEH